MIELRVLFVDDSNRETTKLLNELKKADFSPVHKRVNTRDGMELALAEQEWEVYYDRYILT